MDVSATTLLANMPNCGNSDNYLPSDDHSLLTPEEKDKSRNLNPNMKAVSLKGRNSVKPMNRFNNNKHNDFISRGLYLLRATLNL